jgi:DNA-binding NtrC family response regulator
MQVKMLRALQEGEFERVGGIQTVKVDVRLVAATNKDLVKEIENGRFREDLYYRLNVVPIHIPPLRERHSDIPNLVSHILEKFKVRLGKEVDEVAPEAMERLQRYEWPGNVRELENLLERTILFCKGPQILLEDLPEDLQRGPAAAKEARPAAEGREVGIPAGEASLKQIVRAETERVERELILAALKETGGNVTHAAKRLKISRKSLQNKMKELGLRDREDPQKS